MKRFIPLSLFTIFILVITYLAYTNLLPKEILKKIPYYDSIGHFVLFGTFAFLAELALKGKKFYFIPIGAGLIAMYATIDELLQQLSPNRSFDVSDLFFSLLGVLVARLIFKYIYGNKH